MHAASIEFDHAFLVGKAAKADTIVFGIVFGATHYTQGRIERVGAALEHGERFIKVVVAVSCAKDDRALPTHADSSSFPGIFFLGFQGERNGSDDSGGKKVAARPGHERLRENVRSER